MGKEKRERDELEEAFAAFVAAFDAFRKANDERLDEIEARYRAHRKDNDNER